MAEKIKISELKNSKAEKRIVLSTGFRNVDTAIGYRMYDPVSNELMHVNRGMLSGGIITVIGASHTGKSTWCSQLLANMARPWILAGDKRVKIHFFSIEDGIDRNRFRITSKLKLEDIDDHVVFEENKSIEAVKKCILDDVKEKQEKDYQMIQTRNHMGQPILIHHPTFILIDSVTKLVTDKVQDLKNDTTNAMYMQVAGELDRFLKQHGYIFQKYNITLMSTAHTGIKIDPNAMPGMRPKKKFKYLPATLDIKAPDSFVYDCSFGINLETILASDRKAVEEKCSAGYLDAIAIIEGRFYKSRQPGEGATFTLVQDTKGFSPEKSLIYECQKRKILQSKPGYRELEGYGKVKNSDLLETFKTDANFRRCLFAELDKEYEESLDSGRLSNEEVDISNMVYDLMNEEF